MNPLLCLLLFAGIEEAGIRPAPWPPNGYACPRVDSAPVLDGRLDDAVWDRAQWTSDFVDIEGDRRPAPRFRTRAKMLWDDQYFYVAAEMEEPDLWATLLQRDSVIYYDNDFEVFIDPDGDSHLYTEIELNALNTVWDLLLIKPYRDGGPAIHAWDIPGLQTAVHLDGSLNDPSDRDTGWSVEIAIPFDVLRETTTVSCPPEPGDRWRVNFSRVQWHLEQTDDGYSKTLDAASGKSLPEDNWVWSPQREIAMHEPEHWGIVEFVSGNESADVTPRITDAIAWHLRNLAYQLQRQKETTGHYPLAFSTSYRSEGPLDSLADPDYWSDGRRYTLRAEHQGHRVTLDENGRLTVGRSDQP